MLEILAQRYNINQENKEWSAFMTYDFAGSYTLNRVEKIWERAYNLIANTNLIIKNCDERREVLPDDYYQMIKGAGMTVSAYMNDICRFSTIEDERGIDYPFARSFSFALSINF